MTKAFQPVRKKSLADAVFDQLRGRIIRGKLKPGEALPGERALAEMLDVNRGALREALKRLEQARLISIRQGGATTVLNFRETAGTDLLSALLLDEEGGVNVLVARSVLEMRSALAPSIARFCARRSPDVVPELDEVLTAMEEARGDLVLLQQGSLQFWEILVRGSQNIAYELAFNSLKQSYQHFSELLTMAMADEFEALELYRALRDAVAAGDEESASRHGGDIVARGEMVLTGLLAILEHQAEEE